DLGVKRIEQKLGVDNLYEESFDTIHHIESALKAKTLYLRDKEYIVREGQVIIVDEHTGRLMYGRRYSDGLHQAIEAKEGAQIQQESRTLATISLQNYFRLYERLSGMTGTAATEAEEFKKIYDVEVLVIPTNVPVVREDKPDQVYKSTAAKYGAIVRAVAEIHETGRPILLGTRSIEHNQIISDLLKRKGVPHQVLNAKNHEKEAFIIADAGKNGAITVATNIAGRGVDIVLGGSKPELKDFRKKSVKAGQEKEAQKEAVALGLRLPPSVNPAEYKLGMYANAVAQWQAAHDEIVAAGGLYIVGTERHESRRIDNQLRGRSGRQGDPGTTQFFVSLEDEIMRIFGGEQIAKIMDFLKIDENMPIEHSMVSKSIESAQVKVEGFFFDQRKRLVEFDDVMNKQREVIYQRRRRLLEQASTTPDSVPGADSLTQLIKSYVDHEVTTLVSLYAPKGFTPQEYEAILKEFCKIIPFDQASQKQLMSKISTQTDVEAISQTLSDVAEDVYRSKEQQLGSTSMRELERIVTLTTLDQKWMDHLDAMDSLREGIWLRGDKKTVLSEYKKEAFAMFEALVASIEASIASAVYRAVPNRLTTKTTQLNKAVEHKEVLTGSLAEEVAAVEPPSVRPVNAKGSLSDLAQALGSTTANKKATPGSAQVKIGRNDPCPCGSGLKYKKCGLINASVHKA
ncbi:SEC-C domain-containing protein, partial [Candidatus Woesebacteria bacterium]|nr:SEC-C domain-containing protein [Candidatus Woesebacteria bacterium]